ncbi:transmembrane protein 273 [Sorex araneus]|uniref:transmembrane protein 273 n=1 Tax=Sorex araneus TaxID=42254 RepID=UPI002433E903|nr:transmembrane protein 273 [Sorex araneus]
MDLRSSMQTVLPLLLLLDIGGAQVLATGKSAGADIDIKYALIGTALGLIISAGFLVLKICMIKKNLCDNNTPEPKSTRRGSNSKGIVTISPSSASAPDKDPRQFPSTWTWATR